MKKLLTASIMTALTLMTVNTGTAGAWYYKLKATGSCQDNGSYKIMWKVDNSSEPEQLEIKYSSNTSVVSVGTKIAARQTQTFTQVVDGTKAGDFSLTLRGDWKSDRKNMEVKANIKLDKACDQPKVEEPEEPTTPTTPVTPTVPPTGGGGQVQGQQITVTPVGAVNAGQGTASYNPAAVIAMISSVVVAGIAIVRRHKLGA